MKVLNKILFVAVTIFILPLTSCTGYLDVVPDNTMKLESIFNTKAEAYNALAKIYSYLPHNESQHDSEWLMGDEYIGRLDPDYNNSNDRMKGIRIMRGLQNSNDPILGLWDGSRGARPLYEGIRQCNVFLEYIGRTKHLSEEERSEWRAHAKFLKAYYHFLLVQHYGPIVIADKVISPEALSDELFQYREKVDVCFDYIIKLIDEALPDLKEIIQASTDYGMIDRTVALSIKARILFFRASPFFSGNAEYFGDFYDPRDGKTFFPMDDAATTKNKLKEALDATEAAIELCEKNGKKLYTYNGELYISDREDYAANPKLKTLYDIKMSINTPWNEELVWGYSNIALYGSDEIGDICNIRLPREYGGDYEQAGYSSQWMCTPYIMTERFYTKNGLPIDEDLTFDYNNRQGITKSPNPNRPDGDPMQDEDFQKYQEVRGFLQPNADLINLYLNREIRFYANLGITGGYWRGHMERIAVSFFASGPGGYNAGSDFKNDYLCTGIGIQKFVHPESRSGAWQRVVRFPYPYMRMADLYLMKAEILNEYEGPSQKVYDELNKIRRRAGIPDVETVWSDPNLAKRPGRHLTQNGLREIILRERSIELAFEGSRYWDVVRHKRGPQEFSSAIQGWNYQGSSASTFFVLGVRQARKFNTRDCLWPISLNEMNTNGNLVQNPGW